MLNLLARLFPSYIEHTDDVDGNNTYRFQRGDRVFFDLTIYRKEV